MKSPQVLVLGIIALGCLAQVPGASAVEMSAKTQADNRGEDITKGIEIAIPVVATGNKDNPINWSATVGFRQSETREGTYVRQIVDGKEQYNAVSDGAAQYASIGVQGRTYLFNTKWLEGVVAAEYGKRLSGGTTQYSVWSQANEGRLYDPYSGVTVATGLNFVMGADGYRQAKLGVRFERNLRTGTHSTLLRISIQQ